MRSRAVVSRLPTRQLERTSAAMKSYAAPRSTLGAARPRRPCHHTSPLDGGPGSAEESEGHAAIERPGPFAFRAARVGRSRRNDGRKMMMTTIDDAAAKVQSRDARETMERSHTTCVHARPALLRAMAERDDGHSACWGRYAFLSPFLAKRHRACSFASVIGTDSWSSRRTMRSRSPRCS